MTQERLVIPIDVDLTPMRTQLAGFSASLGKMIQFKAPKIKPIEFDQNETSEVVQSLENTKSVMGAVSSAATNMQFQTNAATKSFKTMSFVLSPLKLMGNQFGLIAGTTAVAANSAARFSAALGMVSFIASYAATGLGTLLLPLRGLLIATKLVASAFTFMFRVILAPFKLLFSAISLVYRGMVTLLKPVWAVAIAFFRFKILLASLRLQFVVFQKLMSFLPPKIRLVVGALALLGVTGRAGAAALRMIGVAALPAKAGFQLAKVAANLATLQFKSAAINLVKLGITLGQAAVRLTLFASKLARLSFRGAIAGMKNLGKASVSVARKIGGGLVGSIRSAIKWSAGLLAIGAGWGIKLAADAEQAQIAFQTMMKSGDAAKAVLIELEQFAASTPFQLDSLRDGAKQLLNAQVPATNLTNRLRMLGDIAAGTGKPINDFVRIFAKVKSTGKVSLETLNQLAERGVPIYDALQKQLGKSRTEMLKMISKGKVGFNDLDGALKATATGAGVFAGGMAAQSKSVSGLFSTLKDNVGFAMRSLGVEIIDAFNFKGLMNKGIAFFQRLKDGIASARPVFFATANVLKAVFNAVWEVVAVTFNAITNALGVTGGDWMKSFVTWAAVATFAFKNWPTIAELAFVKLKLMLVKMGADFSHLFAVGIPTVISKFWTLLTSDARKAAGLVKDSFVRMGESIRETVTDAWNYIKTGGEGLKLGKKGGELPIVEEFESSILGLADIPPRAIGPLEQRLTAESKKLGSALSSGLAGEISNNLKMLDQFRLDQANLKLPTLDGFKVDPITVEENLNQKSERKSTLVESLDRGSTEALKAIFAGQQQDKTAQKQLTVQKQIKNGIMKLVAKPVPEFEVAGAVS